MGTTRSYHGILIVFVVYEYLILKGLLMVVANYLAYEIVLDINQLYLSWVYYFLIYFISWNHMKELLVHPLLS